MKYKTKNGHTVTTKKEFEVTYQQLISYTATIEAESREDASILAEHRWFNGDFCNEEDKEVIEAYEAMVYEIQR